MLSVVKIVFFIFAVLTSTANFLFAQTDSITAASDLLSISCLSLEQRPKVIFKGDHFDGFDGFRPDIVSGEIDPFRTDINYPILAGLGVGYIGAAAYLHIYQKNAWWADDRVKFHFTNDWNYALGIDKIGHFYGTNILAHAFSGAFDASNIQAEQSALYSALAAFSFESLIEYEDGYGKEWGFSPGDFGADFSGALFYIGQYYYPFLKNFQPRFSYIPTKEFREDPNKIIIDDYEGQKYWISMRVKNFLPGKASEYWPSFLNLSAGMGVRGLDGAGGGQREFYLAFDIDAEELIPFDGPFWLFVKNSLNYFHFPMPGIRITPDTAFFGIVF